MSDDAELLKAGVQGTVEDALKPFSDLIQAVFGPSANEIGSILHGTVRTAGYGIRLSLLKRQGSQNLFFPQILLIWALRFQGSLCLLSFLMSWGGTSVFLRRLLILLSSQKINTRRIAITNSNNWTFAFDNLIWPHLDTYNWPHLIN